MTEIIINYPNKAALVRLATALGYYDPVGKAITTQGAIATGGSYFFNNVGQVVATPAVYDSSTFPPTIVTPAVMAPGLWARLRHNADPQRLQDKIAQSKTAADALGITIYKRATINGQSVWTADGSTAAPAYVDLIGVIA